MIEYFCRYLLLLSAIECYPAGKSDISIRSDDITKDEKLYPNGTIVGTYSYLDKEGQPIMVKYYADEGGYGVELKSVKTITTNAEPFVFQMKKLQFGQNTKPPLEIVTELDPLKEFDVNKYKTDATRPEEHKPKNNKKPDYEIYVQNDLKTRNSDKEKIHVYVDKNKRKIRKVNDFNFCY